MSEFSLDLCHLGHVELLTPRHEESTNFFTDVLGMHISGYEKNSVFLRARDDYELHSIKLTASARTGIGHVGWRVRSEAALERRAATLDRAGVGVGWTDGDFGHGRAYRAKSPAGGVIELYYDTRRPDFEIPFAHPSPTCDVRRIDHLTHSALDIAHAQTYYQYTLGLRSTERIEFEGAVVAENRLTSNAKPCEIALRSDSGAIGDWHRLAFVVNGSDDVRRASHVCIEHGLPIETGPDHPIHRTIFVQVTEPGGNRLEICSPGARLALSPDAQTVVRRSGESRAPRWELRSVNV